MEERSTRAFSEIPLEAARISSVVNDHNRSMDQFNFSVDYKKTELEDRLETDNLRQFEAMQASNRLMDKNFKALSDVMEAQQRAKKEGTSVLDAGINALAPYENAFAEDGTLVNQKWNETYRTMRGGALTEGMNADFLAAQARALNNMNAIENLAFQKVATGGNIDSVYGEAFQQFTIQGKDLTDIDSVKEMNGIYNSVIRAKALYLEGTLNGSNSAEVSGAIRGLAKSAFNRSDKLLDANGKAILKNGKEATLDVSLTPETVATLLRTAETIEARGSGTSGAGTSSLVKEYKEFIGYDDITKTGTSDYLMYASPQQAFQDYQSAISTIAADPSLSPKTKINTAQQYSDIYFGTISPTVSVIQAMQATPDSQENKIRLNSYKTDLKKKLNSGESMQGYSMTFGFDKGGSFMLRPNYNAISGHDPEMKARKVWTSIYSALDKATSAQSSADFVYRTNSKYNAAMGHAIDAVDSNTIVNTNAQGQAWLNPQGVADLTNSLKVAGSYLKDAQGNASYYSSIPTEFLNSVVDNYSNFSNREQQLKYVQGVGAAMKEAGYSDFVLNPAITAKVKNKEVLNELQGAVYLSAPNLSGVREIMSVAARTGQGKVTTEAASNYLSTNGISSTSVTDINKIISDKKIPVEYQESFRQTCMDVGMAYAVAATGDPKAKAANIKNAWKTIAEGNFQVINSRFVTQSVFNGSSATRGVDHKRIADMANKAGDRIENTLRWQGIDVGKERITLQPNNSAGAFIASVGGKPVSAINYTTGSRESIPLPLAGYARGNAGPSIGIAMPNFDQDVSNYSAATVALSTMVEPARAQAVAKRFNVPSANVTRDGTRLLAEMSKPTFLKDFMDYNNSSDKFAVTPAPKYMREALSPSLSQGAAWSMPLTDYEMKNSQKLMDKMVDFAYSRGASYNKVNTTVNKPLSFELQGIPYTDAKTALSTAGWKVSREYDPLNVPGVTKSNHNKGFAFDVGHNDNRMINPVTGKLDFKSLDNFVTMINHNPAFKGKVKNVLSSRPELFDDPAYAKYRALKGADGKPLFYDYRKSEANLLARNKHDNHFHVNLTYAAFGPNKIRPEGAQALAKDMAATSTDAYKKLDDRTAAGLVNAFGNDFNKQFGERFGMARMTADGYRNLGIPDNALSDPLMQGRALANRFQRYNEVLGNPDLAVMAIAGSYFSRRDGDPSKKYSIDEIIAGGMGARYKGEFIPVVPPSVKNAPGVAEQKRIMDTYKRYQQGVKEAGV